MVDEFSRQFRLSKQTMHRLYEELAGVLGPQCSSGIDTLAKYCAHCNYFATGSFQQCVPNEETVNLSQLSVSHIIFFCCWSHNNHRQRKGVGEISEDDIWKGDEATVPKCGKLPGVISCVDRTLIAIVLPRKLRRTGAARNITHWIAWW